MAKKTVKKTTVENRFGLDITHSITREMCYVAVESYDYGLATEIRYLANIGVSAYHAIRNQLALYGIESYQDELIVSNAFAYISDMNERTTSTLEKSIGRFQ